MKKITFNLCTTEGISKWIIPASIVLVIFLFGQLFTMPLCAQPSLSTSAAKPGGVKWLAGAESMPGNLKAFQENKGQFNNLLNNGWKILYGADYDGGQILFTDHGVIYTLSQLVPDTINDDDDTDEAKSNAEKIAELQHKKKTIYYNVGIEWENANPSPVIEPQDETPYYFASLAVRTDGHIKGYGKLIYHNIYPNIDIEYTFHKDKGIKYALKLHPGCKASDIKILYTGNKTLSIDDDGNVHIGTELGDIIDHAPITLQNGKNIESAFKKLGGNEVTFQLGHTDPSSEVIIDPWTVSPISKPFIPSDVHMDGSNNVYILGQGTAGMYEQKYTAAGALSWTYQFAQYAHTGYISDLAVDVSGNSYVAMPYSDLNSASGCYGMVGLSTTAGINFYNNTNTASTGTIFEVWNLAYSCDYNELIEGGAPTIVQNDIAVVNATNGNLGTVTKNTTQGETIAGCIAPNGNYYAIAASPSFFGGTCTIVCYTLAAGTATFSFSAQNKYPWTDAEVKNPNGIGTNHIAAGCSYLYTSNGSWLTQRHLVAPGDSVAGVAIAGATVAAGLVPGGIAVDIGCGNVYVGSSTAVEVYSPTLSHITAQATPTIVYGVTYENDLVAACGGSTTANGWVMVFAAQACTVATHTHTNTKCNQSTGAVSVAPSFCTGGTYVYSWSPSGKTTAAVTGLTAGTYTVTIGTSTGCITLTDTVAVTQPPVVVAAMGAPTAATCLVGGSATVTASTGPAPYTYAWTTSPSTTLTATGLSTGTYTVTVTDATGCTATANVTIPGASPPAAPISAQTYPLCNGGVGTATIAPSGGTAPYTYSWSTGPIQTNANATGLALGCYTVTVKGNNGCSTTTSVCVTQPTPVVASISVPCNGISATAAGSGGTPTYTYAWNTTPPQTTATATGLGIGTFTVTVKDINGCSATETVSCTFVLPIDLLYFYCTPVSNGFELSWATATEVNNKYFTIERSGDGINFYPIATIAGAGNSTDTKYYGYEDVNPLNGVNYYRLSQTDFYGNTQEDNVSACSKDKDTLLVYPNPSGGEFTVQLPVQAISNPTTIGLYDLLGREIYTQTVENKQTIDINIPELASGMYILNIITAKKTYIAKILIKSKP